MHAGVDWAFALELEIVMVATVAIAGVKRVVIAVERAVKIVKAEVGPKIVEREEVIVGVIMVELVVEMAGAIVVAAAVDRTRLRRI
jgi:hypothetical protein